jgi:ankyrin repeat protein
MHAAQKDHENVVKLLIAKGADINAEAYFSRGTVLAQAAIGGHMNVVKVLLAKGADVNAIDNLGRSVVWYVKTRQKEIVELLRKHGAKE